MAASKTCPGCQAEIPDGSRFCPQCGTPQALACASCGHSNAAGSRFCAQCGAKLGEPASAAAPPPPKPAPVARRAAAGAERRQLTVMFCDLVGSTALSTKLDPEDLREVIAAYHKCAAEMAARFSGFVAKYMGDGVLIYFGYPEAHEADAENAIRAALAIIEKVTAGAVGDKNHQVRIGIATGLVVVGELVGSGEAQERNVVGETPNLAARLQSAAAPNSVLIDSSTRRLTGDLFEYEIIDPGALKGFDGQVPAWRVLRERTMQSRFEALRAANLAPLLGREEELDLLLRRWQQAKGGEGRVVLLSGEPGIGKSRLTTALGERLAAETPTVMRYFCLPHTQGSALQPIVAHLQHGADFSHDDTSEQKRAKLGELLARSGGDGADASLLAELVGLEPVEESVSPMDPQRRRGQVLAALMGRLKSLARQGPLLMVFEDVQWSDPTSLELLTLTVERMHSLPILLVITHRPDFQPPWAGQPHVTNMTLNRLGRRERMTLVEHVTGGKSLPPALIEQIIERTDGVPLFVEELTKAVLESEELDQPAQQVAVPTTLQASLMARVDRLGSAREVLHIGAAIGREFSYELIAQVAGLPDAVLQDALARLTEAELLLMRGAPPHASYAFKHALVQDTAYSTMLRAHRQALHGAIAQVMEKRFPDTPPEVLAQQFEGGGQSERAIHYWQKAGERDLRRFAMKESIAHYSSALRVIAAMADTPQRSALELGVRLGLGMAQQISMGPASKDGGASYHRALALSTTLPDKGRERFLATWGVWFNATATGRTAEAFSRADELVAIARELDNPDLLLEAYHARTPGLLRKPDFRGMKDSADEVIRLYDRERHSDHAYYFGGHDSRVCAQSFIALGLWGLGFPDQAQRAAWACIEDARSLGHTFTIAHGLNMGGLTHLMLNDLDACRAVAEELYPLAERNKFPWPLMYAKFQRAWLEAQEGDRDAGIEQMMKAAERAPIAFLSSVLFAIVAERQLLAGHADVAMTTLERATIDMNNQQNRFYEAEIVRLRGEILLAQSRGNAADAEAGFRQAIAIAVGQSCRPIELRAATSLARLLAGSGRRAEARAVLAPVYGGFTEGFDRPDLQAAKALLAELK
jgi:class 3 adenylate cyclase/tetratricopeptide (TPR) repeat protein